MTKDATAETANWYSEPTATFGDRLTAAREAAGLTSRDLAQRLGVRLKTVQAWENDMMEPRANRVQMLAGMLNVSLIWLLTGEGAGVVPPDERREIPKEAVELLAEMREVRAGFGSLSERLGRLEARLKLALAREAA